jgi:DNA-binding LytR/AlgR family response regulator
MRVLLVDDERLARKELEHLIKEVCPKAEILEADSGAAALQLFGTEEPDILFLDINLNDMEGTTLATVAKKMLPQAKIIFSTAYSQYAIKAFELGVDDYILKPYEPGRLKQVLERCQKKEEPQSSMAQSKERLAINSNKKTVFLEIDEIAYIETNGRSCILHSKTGDYVENLMLGEYERKLSSYGFYRIHKSYLVNLNEVAELFPWASNSVALRMRGFEKEVLPVSRDKVKQLRRLLHIS